MLSTTEGMNRSSFLHALEMAVAVAASSSQFCAVLYLDCDNFKTINDRYGHSAGDKLLFGIAQRLHGCVRDGDAVARLGGDEFAVLIPSLRHPHDAVQVAEHIISAMSPPFQILEDDMIRAALSVGLAVYPLHAKAPAALLEATDAAMYEAKRDAGNTWRNAPSPSAGV